MTEILFDDLTDIQFEEFKTPFSRNLSITVQAQYHNKLYECTIEISSEYSTRHSGMTPAKKYCLARLCQKIEEQEGVFRIAIRKALKNADSNRNVFQLETTAGFA